MQDAGDHSILVLFDPSAAFDTLLDRLRVWVGLSGSALYWFASCLSNSTFAAVMNNFGLSTCIPHSLVGYRRVRSLALSCSACTCFPWDTLLASLVGSLISTLMTSSCTHFLIKMTLGIRLFFRIVWLQSWTGWLPIFCSYNSNKTEHLVFRPEPILGSIHSSTHQTAPWCHLQPKIKI